MDLQTIRENREGKILQFSIPAIIAMVLTSLITVADGFFMGNTRSCLFRPGPELPLWDIHPFSFPA